MTEKTEGATPRQIALAAAPRNSSGPTGPFTGSFQGIRLDLHSLYGAAKVFNRTADGDLLVVLQRMRALGFDAVKIPFSFYDVSSPTYLDGAIRTCQVTSQAVIRQSVLPPGFDSQVLIGKQLPQIVGTTTGVCNAYLSRFQGVDRLIQAVNMTLLNDMNVILENTDGDIALSDPAGWILSWVQLAVRVSLLGANRSVLVSPLDTTMAQGLQWASHANLPGINDLFKTVLAALDPVLPHTVLLLGGQEGDDFTDASTFLQQTLSTDRSSRIVPYAIGDPLANITGFEERFLYLGDRGVCLTQDTCRRYELAMDVHAGVNVTNITAVSGSSWVAEAADPTDLTWGEVANLVSIGLVPWYSPPSAYNIQPAPAFSIVVAEGVDYTAYPCVASLAVSHIGTVQPYNAVLNVLVRNTRYETLIPPYQIGVMSSTIQGVVGVLGQRNFTAGTGSTNITMSNYFDVLFPNATNAAEIVVVAQLNSSTIGAFDVSVAGKKCSLQIQALS